MLDQLPLRVCSWLIAIAYFLAGGFIKSGLGNRIAYTIVKAFGKTTLGLTYSLVFAEALLSPAIPSVAARAGKSACHAARTGMASPLGGSLGLECDVSAHSRLMRSSS